MEERYLLRSATNNQEFALSREAAKVMINMGYELYLVAFCNGETLEYCNVASAQPKLTLKFQDFFAPNWQPTKVIKLKT